MGFRAPSGKGKESESSLSFMQPMVDLSSMDPAKADKAAADGRRATLRTLNAVKILGPVMAAVVERHAMSGGEEDAVGAFKAMVGQASEMSELVLRELGEDPMAPANFWLRNMLERAFCEILKDQVQRGREPTLRPLEPLLRDVSRIQWQASESPAPFESWAPDTSARVALVRAAAPIMARFAGFNFFRTDLGADIEDIMRLLMGKAAAATVAMADPGASERDRASLFSVLVVEAGSLYASAWHSCGKQMVNNLESLNDVKLAALIAEDPRGLPLDKVNEVFEHNFARLTTLSAKLVPQAAGKIEARIKAQGKSKE